MAEKKFSTKDETMEHVSLLESSLEIWDSRHMCCKEREREKVCVGNRWGETLSTSATEVKNK
jgi:hypothetical protein